MSNYPYPPVSEPVPSTNKRKGRIATAATSAVGFVVLIWAVHIVNVLLGGSLTYFGIHPLDVSSLPYIFTSPWLHLNFSHLMANTVPGALFLFLVGLSGRRALIEVTLIVMILGGLGTWVIGGIGTSHVGASGLIYGWLAYLVVRGIFNRSLSQVALGVVLAFMYGGLIWGVLPTQVGVSWQGHLCGAIAGIVAGATITSDDPAKLIQKRQQKRSGQRLM